MPQIAMIGGGAAGLMAAGHAAACGAAVTLYEKNPFCGKKLRITGKGRCNVCNDCDVNTVIEHVQSGNPRFLYAALNAFPPADVKAFFEENGVPLKTERGNRVFPVSDKAADIAEALRRYAVDAGVHFVHAAVRAVRPEGDGFFVEANGMHRHDRVIIATGGASYPLTGSTGDGFRFAKELGLSVTALRPSLVPLETEESDAAEMQGLSLKNTALTVTDRESGKVVYTDFGEMLFTHYGVSGLMILSASAHLRDMQRGRYAAPEFQARARRRNIERAAARGFSVCQPRFLQTAVRLAAAEADSGCRGARASTRRRRSTALPAASGRRSPPFCATSR